MAAAPKTVPIACANCGANLTVPPTVRFVTCSHCDSSLQIQESGGAFYSELKEDVRAIKAGVERIEQAVTGTNRREAIQHRIARLQGELDDAQREASRVEIGAAVSATAATAGVVGRGAFKVVLWLLGVTALACGGFALKAGGKTARPGESTMWLLLCTGGLVAGIFFIAAALRPSKGDSTNAHQRKDERKRQREKAAATIRALEAEIAEAKRELERP